MTFRRATSVDIAHIVALLVDDDLAKLRDRPVEPVYAQVFTAIDADPNQLLAVAEHDDGLVGCLQITFIPGLSRRGALRGQIEGVRIARELRGQGFGAKMMEWAISQCRERGCTLVQLTTDKKRTDAYRFYQRLGFSSSHEGMKLAL